MDTAPRWMKDDDDDDASSNVSNPSVPIVTPWTSERYSETAATDTIYKLLLLKCAAAPL